MRQLEPFQDALPELLREKARDLLRHAIEAEVAAFLGEHAAKADLHAVLMAPTRIAVEKALDQFLDTYQAKYPKAVAVVKKDRERLLPFYNFPVEHA